MSKSTIFIQGESGVTEAEISLPATVHDLHQVFKAQGIDVSGLDIFVDEAESAVPHEAKSAIEGLKHGSRVHVTRCKKIQVTVHYVERTLEHAFPPGVRVRAVKEWAVHQFMIKPTDA